MSTKQVRYSEIKLGFCPIGKFVFSHEDALKFKILIEEKLHQWGIEYINLDEVLKDGIVRSQEDVEPVVEYFKENDIDAIFMPHCNFGTEGAVGMIGAKLGVPVLLWGPRDEAPLPTGIRLRDTLCGLFASSKVLHKLNVPFTYIENCWIDDPRLKEEVIRFLQAVNVANVFRKGVRIAFIGQRIDFFWSTIINESELLERFKIEVLPIDIVDFIKGVKSRAHKNHNQYQHEIEKMRQSMEIEGFNSDQPLINILAMRDQMLAIAEENKAEGIAIQSFISIVEEMESYGTLAESAVADHYVVGCESDIHGVISGILLRRANFNKNPVFLADLTIRHPTNDNGVLLWHGGAPLSFIHPEEKIRIAPHWILPTPYSGMTHFRLKDGPITVTRFDGDYGNYQLAIGEGKSISGPKTQNNYVWMEVDNWPRWERLLIEGPFIHHIAMTYGHFGKALVEACKYIPGLIPLKLNQGEYEG
jgi:L-fucose isomerase-like protein